MAADFCTGLWLNVIKKEYLVNNSLTNFSIIKTAYQSPSREFGRIFFKTKSMSTILSAHFSKKFFKTIKHCSYP